MAMETPGLYDGDGGSGSPPAEYIDAGGGSSSGGGSSGGGGGGYVPVDPNNVTYQLTLRYWATNGAYDTITGGNFEDTIDTINGPIEDGVVNTVALTDCPVSITGTHDNNPNRPIYLAAWSVGEEGKTWQDSNKTVMYSGETVSKTWNAGRHGTVMRFCVGIWSENKLIIFHPGTLSSYQYYRSRPKTSGTPLTLPSGWFTREGYVQSGWTTTDGGSKEYDFGQTYTPSDNNIEFLYPSWEEYTPPGSIFTITLHPNGGTGEEFIMQVESDSEITIPTGEASEDRVNLFNPNSMDWVKTGPGDNDYKYGHTFTGAGTYAIKAYGDTSSGGAPTYKSFQCRIHYANDTWDQWATGVYNNPIKTLSAGDTLVVFAGWYQPTEEDTISLANTWQIQVAKSSTQPDHYYPYVDEVEYSKEGYHLSVWNESPDGDGSSWIPGETYIFKRGEDVDLYAIWAGDEYTVHYASGVPGDTNYIHESKAVYGEPFYTDRVPYPDGKEYCTFDGWVADDNTVLTKADAWFEAYSYGADSTWTLQRDLVIYPRWTPYWSSGKVFFGGMYSDDCSIKVEEPPSYIWPEYSYAHDKVYGRSGDILRDNGRYENVSKKYKISAYDGTNFFNVSRKVSEWLHRKGPKMYMRLEDSYEPDVYMMGVYEESNELDNLLATAGKCEITFNCMPQKFLLSGDVPIDITESGQVITNPTSNPAFPILTFSGAGTITLNGKTIEIADNFNVINFHTDSFNGFDIIGRNMNGYIYVLDSLMLNPGDNVIEYDGYITDLKVTPRWWRV